METTGERLKKFAKDRYGSVSGLTRELGMGVTALADYTSNRSKPGHELQEKLRKAGCDIEWLMTGIETKRSAWQGINPPPRIVGTIDPPEGTKTRVMLSPASCGDLTAVDDTIAALLEVSKFHNADTFYVEARGESMIGAGIQSGDMLLVDISKEPKNNNIVLVRINDAVSVKRLKTNGVDMLLQPENPEYNQIPVTKETRILAVVLKIEKWLISS